MKLLLTILLVAVVAPAVVYADAGENEVFKQLVVLLELNDDERQKLAVIFVTLEENLYAATVGVGDKGFNSLDLIDGFYSTRVAFRDSVSTVLSPEKFETMQKYSSAIFYELADDVARIRVMEFKDALKLTGDQITALTFVLNEDLRSIVETCIVYNEKDFDNAVADAMQKDILDIRENSRTEVKKILNEDQWTKLQQLTKQ
jgi:hypothetical protein